MFIFLVLGNLCWSAGVQTHIVGHHCCGGSCAFDRISKGVSYYFLILGENIMKITVSTCLAFDFEQKCFEGYTGVIVLDSFIFQCNAKM